MLVPLVGSRDVLVTCDECGAVLFYIPGRATRQLASYSRVNAPWHCHACAVKRIWGRTDFAFADLRH